VTDFGGGIVTAERDEDGIVVITLNRPDRLNALAPTMTKSIRDAFASVHHDRDVTAVVLRGAGRGFCAGADLSGDHDPAPGAAGSGPVGIAYRTQEDLAGLILAVHECEKPVVAAVHGAAVGGGLALALACDLRVATPDARFGAVFHNIGLSGCDVGVSYFLPRIVGPTAAGELMLTGRHFTGTEAHALGMLNRLVAEAQLVAEAVDLARMVVSNSEYGVWMTKRGMWLGIDAPSLRHAIEMENRTQVLGTFTGNTAEGIAAFIQKRDPEWKPF